MKMTVNNRFALLLAEKRINERRNISLAEVAEATGISRKTLYAWENNTVTRFDVPVINALCEYFSIEPGLLFQYVKDKPRKISNLHEAGVPASENETGIKSIKDTVVEYKRK